MLHTRKRKALVALPVFAAAGVLAAAAVGSSSHQSGITPAPAFSAAQLNAYAGDNWLTIGGGLTDNRYSTLNQITTKNVGSMKTTWHSQFGLSSGEEAKAFGEEAAPVEYNGTLFVPDAFGDVFAYDAATGESLWTHKNTRSGPLPGITTQRGIGVGDGNLYVGTASDTAVGLNQTTGKVAWTSHIANAKTGDAITAAPLYYNGMVIYGISGGDLGARGRVVALNAKTGKTEWTWNVTPGPGQPEHNTWSGNEWKHSGSVWVYPSIDPKRGLIYVDTGNPVPWNGRGPGSNKWTDSIVALHVNTGKVKWGYQTVHHDIWDFDVTNPPVIFNAKFHGKMEPGIAVASKPGWVYILNRATGKPLLPIPEVKVPQFPKGSAAAKYSNLSPTQPEPKGSALLVQCTKKSWWPSKAPDGKPFKLGCIFQPYAPNAGAKGGNFFADNPGPASIDWPPSSFNPSTNYLYVCTNETFGTAYGALPKGQQNLVAGKLYVGVNFAFAKGKPKQAGRMIAVNVKTNRIVWKDAFKSACYSGSAQTAGGVGFMAQVDPRKVVAFDSKTGKILWKSSSLNASAMAPPIVYSVNGKEYVAIVAGGGGAGAGISGGKLGDSVYAFALK